MSFLNSAAGKLQTVFTAVVHFIFGSSESEDSRWLRIIVLVAALTVGLLVVAGISAFFLTLQGEEQTMIPDARGRELVDALIDLQEKGLFAQVQVRYSSDPSLKGKVIDQRPQAGSLVKAGKRVTLVVSQGAIVDKVENFIGQDIDEVRTHLATLFATYRPLLRIQEPVTYIFDRAPAGTILEQQPEAGTDLTGLTDLVLIVSRGPETPSVKLASYRGIGFQQAVTLLARNNMPFIFKVVPLEQGQTREFVVAQEPPPGTDVEPNTRVELEIAEPLATNSRGQVFGLFQCSLPLYPVWVETSFEAQALTGERRTLFTMMHPGGEVAIPYYEEPNTALILSISGREVYRDTTLSPP